MLPISSFVWVLILFALFLGFDGQLQGEHNAGGSVY
jgi:hypothetical protein